MAKDTIFRKLRKEAAGRELSVRWYRSKLKELAPRVTADQVIAEGKEKVRPRPTYGMMNLFGISLSMQPELKYYDLFPLVIPFKKHRNGFTGT